MYKHRVPDGAENSHMTAITGRFTTGGIPNSFTSITPFLVLPDARDAIEFYARVFDTRVVSITEVDSVIVHADLDLGRGRLQVGEPSHVFGTVPAPTHGACYSLGFYCSDVDAVVARAVAAGATVREEVSDFVSGDRFGSLTDPFGVRWTVMTRTEDLSEEESQARVDAWARGRE